MEKKIKLISNKLRLLLTKKEKTFLFLCVILVFSLLYVINIANTNSNKLKDALYTIEIQDKKIKTYVDRNGVVHGQVEVLSIDRGIYAQTLKPLAKSLNTKIKNINNIINLNMENQGELSAKIDTQYKIIQTINNNIIKYDTVFYNVVNYKDKFMDFNGKIEKGILNAKYKIRDSLTFVTFSKNTGFLGLGKKKTYIDVQTQNPNISFTQMKNIELTNIKNKKFSVGPCINYGIGANGFQPSIGISLQYSLIRF